MANKTINLTPELYQYLLDSSLREPTVLRALREETMGLKAHEMQIAPDQGQFFSMLIKLTNARRVLEIGTYTGYSALVFALALPEDGLVVTCDINSECTKIARIYWEKAGVSNKVQLKLGKALESLDQLLKDGKKENFDFVFIDADKCNNDNYYEKSLSLLRKGGLIAVDNVLWHGRVIDKNDHEKTTQAVREFNNKVLSDSRVDLSMIPVGDGISLARKR